MESWNGDYMEGWNGDFGSYLTGQRTPDFFLKREAKEKSGKAKKNK